MAKQLERYSTRPEYAGSRLGTPFGGTRFQREEALGDLELDRRSARNFGVGH